VESVTTNAVQSTSLCASSHENAMVEGYGNGKPVGVGVLPVLTEDSEDISVNGAGTGTASKRGPKRQNTGVTSNSRSFGYS
jgi:hypothetical protein